MKGTTGKDCRAHQSFKSMMRHDEHDEESRHGRYA